MNTFEKQAAQGDLIIIKINEIPGDATAVEPRDGQHIVAHSETGHNHVVSARDSELYRPAANDNMILYLRVNNDTALTHLRSYDTHKPINLKPGNYQIRRQREYTPEGWRRVED